MYKLDKNIKKLDFNRLLKLMETSKNVETEKKEFVEDQKGLSS